MIEDRAISLNAVIKAVDEHTLDDGTLDDDISCILEDLPPVTPNDEEMAMQYQRGYIDGFKEGKVTFEPKPCDDAISRDAVLEKAVYTETEEGWSGYTVNVDYIKSLPSVKPQESSITWVTGADGAKIAFWDVPVWKVTKICEILGDPQEGANE